MRLQGYNSLPEPPGNFGSRTSETDSAATRLGLGVYSLFIKGETGCMTTIDRGGNISPLYLKDVEDKNGKVKPRLVNMESEAVQVIFRNNLHYITKEDYRAEKKYVNNPEDYDFFKILNWDE